MRINSKQMCTLKLDFFLFFERNKWRAWLATFPENMNNIHRNLKYGCHFCLKTFQFVWIQKKSNGKKKSAPTNLTNASHFINKIKPFNLVLCFQYKSRCGKSCINFFFYKKSVYRFCHNEFKRGTSKHHKMSVKCCPTVVNSCLWPRRALKSSWNWIHTVFW